MRRPAVTSFTLKVVAIAGMTCNHVANIFALQLPGWITVGLCSLGGLTFPIMAFLLCEGYRHTSNLQRYAKRLAIFALVAQVPYSLLWGATANVLVTLLMGLGLLWADDHLRSRLAFGALFAGVLVISLWCDWGVIGPLMIYLFHRLLSQGARKAVGLTMLTAALALAFPAASSVVAALEGSNGAEPSHAPLAYQTAKAAEAAASEEALLQTESPWVDLLETPSAAASSAAPSYTVEDAGALVGGLGGLGYATLGFGLAALLLINYNGQRGRPLKWFFYIYYPTHLIILWALAQIW